MKTLLKTALICVALIVMTACSAQKRAERHVRKAVALCPELVQLKAHRIDTALTVPGFADMAAVPLKAVLKQDTLYAATEHGTVVVSLRQSDSALRVGFVAAPRELRFHDTVHYAQVVPRPKPEAKPAGRFWSRLASWIFGIAIGMSISAYLLRHALKNKP